MPDKRPTPRLDQVADLKVPLAVVLAETAVPLDELLELRPGAVIELKRRQGTPLELRLNGETIGSGRAVEVGSRLGLIVEAVQPGTEEAHGGEGS